VESRDSLLTSKENCQDVLARATHKTKRQIEELIAELAPRPDVPAVMRKLPERAPRVPAVQSGQLVPERVEVAPTVTPKLPTPAPVVAPLSPSRYKVQFTADAELREKLERLQALMKGDLAEVIEAAVTEKLERLEAKKYAETKTPRKRLDESDTSPKSRYVPAAVKRAVRKRDGDRCRFVSAEGRRCTERRGLEIHRHDPFGRGGSHDPDNLSLLCKRHNAFQAERDYGKDVFARYRDNLR
jgi:hypothetical protein